MKDQNKKIPIDCQSAFTGCKVRAEILNQWAMAY